MKILYGLKDGAVLQRDEQGFCKCLFKADANGEITSTMGDVADLGNGDYVLTGIPTGGAYTFTLSDDDSRQAFTVWVGDLWLLGGQSNMEGAGKENERVKQEAKNAAKEVRAYYVNGSWDRAAPVLHCPWLSSDEAVGGFWRRERRNSVWKNEDPYFYQDQKVDLRAVGPGYYIAKRMYEITGVPQGVIPCALGGSGMEKWTKDAPLTDNLYVLMQRRFRETGSFVRGMFWDQGESEAAYENKGFTGKMQRFIADVRKDFGNEKLPVVQVQIAQTAVPSICNDIHSGIWWSFIKEEQRTMCEKIKNLVTVSAIDADYDDLIHYSAAFQEKMGIRCANAMADMIGIGGAPVPVLDTITVDTDKAYTPCNCIIRLHYKNVKNFVCAGRPSGFTVVDKSDDMQKIYNPAVGVQKIEWQDNIISIYTEIPVEKIKDAVVYYGFGHMAYCNIGTDAGYALAAMGPVCIGDFL